MFRCYSIGPVVQLVRTLACHARGREFESHPGRHCGIQLTGCHNFASVAQLVEQWTENPRVVGSIPTGGTMLVLITQRVHLFPFRTQKLSSAVVTILGWRRPGKIARCQLKMRI